MSVEGHAFARAGLLGNPSDGYFGRTLSVVLRDFRATVTLTPSHAVRIQPDRQDEDTFESVEHLAEMVSRQGYYGATRLAKAAVKVFHDHCAGQGIPLAGKTFTLHSWSSIPRQVGLGGSSAIATAALRALMQLFQVDIPREVQPGLILSAEVDELGITAGLQDRVAQVYEDLVYMDFSRDVMEARGHGAYESLDPALLPSLFLAYQPRPVKVSGAVLSNVRSRWERGEVEVHETLDRIAQLATEGREALLRGDRAAFATLIDENFDLRRRIMRIDDLDVSLVEAARSLGASAKLTGSGGAVIGTCEGPEMLEGIVERLGALGARVMVPTTVRDAAP